MSRDADITEEIRELEEKTDRLTSQLSALGDHAFREAAWSHSRLYSDVYDELCTAKEHLGMAADLLDPEMTDAVTYLDD